MKRELTTVLLFFLLLLTAGCQEDIPHSVEVETGKEQLAFNPGNTTQTVKIGASHAWRAVASESWLTVSPGNGGAGTHELTLTAAANPTTATRTARVDVQVGEKTVTIHVSQGQKDALGLDRNSEVVGWPAGSLRFTLSTNVTDYKITSDAAWLQPSSLKAMTEHTLLLAYEENPGYEERSGKVTVSNGKLSSSVTVTQGGRGALYFVTGRDTVAAAATQYNLTLMKNTELSGLHLLDEVSWVSLPSATKAVPVEERIRLTLQPNNQTEPRRARLVIRDESTGVLLTDTFTLVQRAMEHHLIAEKELYEVPAGGADFGIAITATRPFEVVLPEDAPWLKGPEGVQLGGTLQFSAEANRRPQSRTAVIVLRLQGDKPLEARITIRQAAAEVADTDRLPRLYNLLALGTVVETDPVNLGAFRATVSYDSGDAATGWLNDIYANGGKLHFRVDENSTSAKRSATIRLTFDDIEPVEIRVNQSGASEAYIELEKAGTLASFIDYPNKEHYKNIRLVAPNGIDANDINTLRNPSLAAEEIDLKGVRMTELPDEAFSGSRTLRRVVLPSGLTTIGVGAFEGCSALEIGSFPASLLSIGERAFAGAFAGAFTGSESIQHLDLSAASALRTIGREAFRGCNTLTQLTLPANLTEIGEGAFSECYNLKEPLTLPSLLKTVGAEAFYNCKNLTGTLKLPASLTALGERAFMRCAALEGLDLSVSRLTVIGAEAFKESLSSVTGEGSKLFIPSGVTAVAAGAFEDTGFTEADLPASLSQIGRRAFYNCRQLRVVTCRRTATAPALDDAYPAETFGGVGIPGTRELKVDAGSKDIYAKDPLWLLATPTTPGGSVVWEISGIGTEK